MGDMSTRAVFMIIAFLTAGCTALIGGCAGTGSGVELRTIERGVFSGISCREPVFAVIADTDAYEALFARIGVWKQDSGAAPPVDFEKQLVVAVLMGEKPTAGYTVAMNKTARVGHGILTIDVITAYPPPDALTAQVVTSPYALAVVERGGYTRVAFVDAGGNVMKTVDVPNFEKIP